MAKTTVEKFVLGRIKKCKPQAKGEDDQTYRRRLADALQEIPEEEYDAMPEAVRTWYEGVAEAVKAEKDLPAPDAKFDEPAATEAKEEKKVEKKAAGKKEAAKTEPKKEEPKKEAKKAPVKTDPKKPEAKKEAKKEEPKKEKAPKKPAGEYKEPRESSASDMIKLFMCKNPSATQDQIGAQLKEKKVTFGEERLTQIYSATRRVLDILKALGKLEFKAPKAAE